MHFFSTVLAVALSSIAARASPVVERAILDVYSPHVTSPVAGDSWPVNSVQTITWSTAGAPVNITNPTGSVYLRQGDTTEDSPLAQGFSILDGSVNVTVPFVLPGDDYQVVLFGDSGNFSPDFSITWL